VITVLPTELNDTKSVLGSRSSQQSSQTDSSTDQASSFQSLLRTATNSSSVGKSDDEGKSESKADRKKGSDATPAARQDQADQLASSYVVTVPLQQQVTTTANVNVAAQEASVAFDVTKAAETVPVVTADASTMPVAAIAVASKPEQPAVDVTSSANAAQTAQAVQTPSANAPISVPDSVSAAAVAAGQIGSGLASSLQVPSATSVPGDAVKSAVESAVKSAGVAAANAGPTHLDANVAAAATAAVNPVTSSVTAAPQLAVEAGLKFQLPKVQSLEPIPGAASASKLKNDSAVSSAGSTTGINGAAAGTATAVKGKDQHERMDNGSDGSSTSNGQQTTPSPVSANSAAAGQSGNTHVDASAFQTAAAVSSPRNAEVSGNSQSSKAEVAQADVASAPAAAAVAQIQDLQAKVSTARLVQGIHDSELRVGMRSGEFGDISIHTSLSRSAISAQISVEHGELAKVIAASLPELRSALGNSDQLEVRVAMHGQVSPQMDLGGRGAGQGSQRESRSAPNSSSLSGNDSTAAESAVSAVAQVDTARATLPGRVDVRI
jgi:hypothetical protein